MVNWGPHGLAQLVGLMGTPMRSPIQVLKLPGTRFLHVYLAGRVVYIGFT